MQRVHYANMQAFLVVKVGVMHSGWCRRRIQMRASVSGAWGMKAVGGCRGDSPRRVMKGMRCYTHAQHSSSVNP